MNETIRIFVSYTKRDGLVTSQVLENLYENLKKISQPFIHSINKNPSKYVQFSVLKNLMLAHVFILIESPETYKSPWVLLEIFLTKIKLMPVIRLPVNDFFLPQTNRRVDTSHIAPFDTTHGSNLENRPLRKKQQLSNNIFSGINRHLTIRPMVLKAKGMGKKLKHLDYTQILINRMTANSFLLKVCSVILATGLLALSFAGNRKITSISISFVPVMVFWILDGYFLWQERLFRRVYDHVRKLDESEIDFKMNPKAFMDKETWPSAIFSKTLLIFYLALIVVMTAVVLFLTFGAP